MGRMVVACLLPTGKTLREVGHPLDPRSLARRSGEDRGGEYGDPELCRVVADPFAKPDREKIPTATPNNATPLVAADASLSAVPVCLGDRALRRESRRTAKAVGSAYWSVG
jgi:hypothetical protein